MAFYSVLDIPPLNDSWIPDYLPAANRLVAAHGGTHLARTSTHEQLEGEATPAARPGGT